MGSGCQGLFGQSGGNIRGITLADARITGYIDYDPSLGGIVGANSGTVSDCHVAATVTIRAYLNHYYSYKLGGIVGENKGTVSDCTSAATLTTNESSLAYHGGIAGYNYSGTLSHNLAIGADVPAADNSHGAICGISDGGTLENNYYHACTVAGTENATGVGCGKADITDNNGAVPAYVLTRAHSSPSTRRATMTPNTPSSRPPTTATSPARPSSTTSSPCPASTSP